MTDTWLPDEGNCPKKQKFMKDLTHATYCKRKFDAKNNNCNFFSTVPCK